MPFGEILQLTDAIGDTELMFIGLLLLLLTMLNAALLFGEVMMLRGVSLLVMAELGRSVFLSAPKLLDNWAKTSSALNEPDTIMVLLLVCVVEDGTALLYSDPPTELRLGEELICCVF